MTQQKISGISLALIGGLVFFVVPFQVESNSSAAYPRIISILLIIFSVVLTLLPERKQGKSNGVNLFDPLLLIYMTIVIVAIVVIQLIGFYPAIVITLPMLLYLFGERDYKKIAGFSLIITATIYVIMNVILRSNLP